MELRDKSGLTEAEFLAQYSPKDYPRPSLTADVAVFARDAREGGLRLLMVRRGGHPCLGCWALPGGFVNPDENADDAAARELAEETGIAGISCEQFGFYSAPGRDPRGWTVSSAYVTCLDASVDAQGGDDAAEARWCPIDVSRQADGSYSLLVQAADETLTCTFELREARFLPARARILSARGFAFDHAQIVSDAWLAIQA